MAATIVLNTAELQCRHREEVLLMCPWDWLSHHTCTVYAAAVYLCVFISSCYTQISSAVLVFQLIFLNSAAHLHMMIFLPAFFQGFFGSTGIARNPEMILRKSSAVRLSAVPLAAQGHGIITCPTGCVATA